MLWSFNKFSQAVFQEMYGGQCGEFVCWSWGFKGLAWSSLGGDLSFYKKWAVTFFQACFRVWNPTILF